MKINKNAFTLIELVAVLVILAILALIVTPIVMNIISKAKDSANKRSIDAYGRSIELAIASHLIETGNFPTSIEELTIEYNGDEVVCETQELNSDSTVYLANCTVGGKAVEGYTYGKSGSSDSENISYTAYQVGDHVSYNGVTYYVIEDSDATNNTVKMLKENPLLKTEIDTLNTGITVEEQNGYGRVQFGSSTDYSTSTVKQVVDSWKNNAVKSVDSASVRLITYDELTDNLGYEKKDIGTIYPSSGGDTPSWVYNSNYGYWTMSQYEDSSYVWYVLDNGGIDGLGTVSYYMVRPVLELNKSANITKID